jgi:Protein of unknown function (DUF4238)
MGAAKLHHYVSQLLLRRFSAQPRAKNPLLVKLDLKTGRPSPTSVKNEAAISHYNRPEQESKIPPGLIEETLSKVETAAARPIQELVDGRLLTQAERLDVALFAFLQWRRTPLSRAWQRHTLETGAKLHEMGYLADQHAVQEAWARQGKHFTLEEAASWGQEIIRELEQGDLTLEASTNAVLGAMFIGVENMPQLIAQKMTWIMLHSNRSNSFIISDHPVSLYDPEAGPRRGAGWFSSPKVEVTLPLDACACLLLVPGPPELHHESADAQTVLEANLRTYATAQWAIYGPTQAAVQHVRTVAKRQPSRAARLAPWPPLIHILEQSEDKAGLRAVRIYSGPRTAQRGRTKP